MSHFLMSEVKTMESVFHSRYFREFMLICNTMTPRGTESMFDSFQLPKEIIDLLECQHHVIGEDSH